MIIFTPNTVIKSTEVNSNFADAIDLTKHTNNYRFSAYLNSSFTVTDASHNTLKIDTEAYDPNNNFNTSTYKYTIPADGVYEFKGACRANAPDTNGFWGWFLSIRRDRGGALLDIDTDESGFYPAGRQNVACFHVAKENGFLAGDLIYLVISCDPYTSANTTITAEFNKTWFQGRYICSL